MRGQPFHNSLIGAVEALLLTYGAEVALEYRVTGSYRGAVDLYAELAGSLIVVEAELRPARLANDIRKALALKADLLVIVVPTRKLARFLEPKIEVLKTDLKAQSLCICCQPLAVCLQTLTCFCQNRMSYRQNDPNPRRSS